VRGQPEPRGITVVIDDQKQSLLGGTRQDELVIDQLELRNRDGDIVLHQAEKAAGIDDRICNGLISGDDDVIDR